MMNREYNTNIIIPGLLQTEDNVLREIFKYLCYHDLATIRIVCRRFKEIIRPLLNEGFHTVRKIHRKCLKDIKEILPRRESQRLMHTLGGHYLLLSCIDPKIELLYLTFLKYKNEKSRIFIPGKVLDELFRSLRLVQDAIKVHTEGGTINDSEQKLNNLRIEVSELMTAAIYSFEDAVLPETSQSSSAFLLPEKQPFLNTAGTSQTKRFTTKEKKCVNAIKFASLQIELNMSYKRLKDREQAVLELNKVLNEQTVRLREHENQLGEISNSIAENDSKMLSLMNRMSLMAGVPPSLRSTTSDTTRDDDESRKNVGISIPCSISKKLETVSASNAVPEIVTDSSNVNVAFDKKRKRGGDNLFSGTGGHKKCSKKL